MFQQTVDWRSERVGKLNRVFQFSSLFSFHRCSDSGDFVTYLNHPKDLGTDPSWPSSAGARRGDQPWCWYVFASQKVRMMCRRLGFEASACSLVTVERRREEINQKPRNEETNIFRVQWESPLVVNICTHSSTIVLSYEFSLFSTHSPSLMTIKITKNLKNLMRFLIVFKSIEKFHSLTKIIVSVHKIYF